MGLLEAARRLSRDLAGARLDVPYVYDPLDYAWDAHASYVRRYGEPAGPGRVLLVGMNPGPWGMGQTGVPFGDVTKVRDWMGVTGAVAQPARVHPKRPVLGFATTRAEPSGTRLYGWAGERWGTAASFFAAFFVANYCPLLFFDDAGRNLTPPQLRARDRDALGEACDRHLAAVVRATRPSLVVGVGQYAEERARAVVGGQVPVGRVLHPSPASPAANRGWAAEAERQLAALGVKLPVAARSHAA